MACYTVGYDLVKRKDYPELISALEEIGAVKCLLSQWLVESDSSAKVVYDYLVQHIDSDDRLMVFKFETKPTWNVGLKGTKAWIDARFPT